MQDHDRNLIALVVIGAAIGLGKLFAGNETLTWRLMIGRTLIGAATSMVAGVILLSFDNVNPVALYGMGSALGIAGAQVLERLLIYWGTKGKV